MRFILISMFVFRNFMTGYTGQYRQSRMIQDLKLNIFL